MHICEFEYDMSLCLCWLCPPPLSLWNMPTPQTNDLTCELCTSCDQNYFPLGRVHNIKHCWLSILLGLILSSLACNQLPPQSTLLSHTLPFFTKPKFSHKYEVTGVPRFALIQCMAVCPLLRDTRWEGNYPNVGLRIFYLLEQHLTSDSRCRVFDKYFDTKKSKSWGIWLIADALLGNKVKQHLVANLRRPPIDSREIAKIWRDILYIYVLLLSLIKWDNSFIQEHLRDRK